MVMSGPFRTVAVLLTRCFVMAACDVF
uniref:Uncharacterized protein n=1 Tax=Anguilla anguilla TaxID=7936 RepID=A0A0E9QS64_ANGAN